METNAIERNIFNQIAWIIFIILLCFASALPGFDIPGIGYLYPLRLCLPFMALYLFINERKYGSIGATLSDTMVFMTVLLIYGLITLAWTADKVTSIKHLFNYVIGFLIVLVMVWFVRTKYQFYTIIMFMAYVMIVIMVMGIFESLTGKYFFTDQWTEIKPYAQRDIYYPVVSFGNPNDLVFVAFGIMPFIHLTVSNLSRQSPRRKKFYYFVFVLYFLLYCIVTVLASCRMGMLLIPIAIIVNMIFSRNRYIYYFALLICLIGIIVLSVNYTWLLDFFNEDARIVIWQNILKNAAYYKFMGTGPGNSILRIEGIEYIKDYLTNPHFFFLEVFAEFGIFVSLIMLLWVIFTYMRARNNYIYAVDIQNRRISCTAIKFMIYFIPMSVMSSSIAAMPQFWFILSLMLIAVKLSRPNKNNSYDISERYNNFSKKYLTQAEYNG